MSNFAIHSVNIWTALLLGIIFLISSCELKPCEGFSCINGEAQPDGNDCFCICDKGWRGEDCTIENPCVARNVVCLNGGTCVDGTCQCEIGFEGDSCQIFVRDRYVGTYSAIDNCNNLGTLIYQMTITADEKPTYVQFSNELTDSQYPEAVEASAGTNGLNIATQIVLSDTSGNITLSGSAILSNDTLYVNYQAIDNRNPPPIVETCNGIWVKQ